MTSAATSVMEETTEGSAAEDSMRIAQPSLTPVSSLPEGAYALAFSELLHQRQCPMLYVARDDTRMAAMRDSLGFFAPNTLIISLPAWDCLPYDRVSPHPIIISERIDALTRIPTLSHTQPAAILTTVNALLQRVPPREHLTEEAYRIRPGDELDRESLAAFLTRHGYTRIGKVMEPGEFAMRGSIIDIFPAGGEDGVRLDCFGDEVESLHRFDPLKQTSEDALNELSLLPANEVMLDDDSIARFRKGFREAFGAAHGHSLYEAISDGRKQQGMEHWLPLFVERMDTLFDYLPQTPLIVDHLATDAMRNRLELIADYYDARQSYTGKKVGEAEAYHPLPPTALYLSEQELIDRINTHGGYQLSSFDAPAGATNLIVEKQENDEHPALDLQLSPSYNFAKERKTGTASGNRDSLLDAILTYLRNQQSQGKRALIACYSNGSRERIRHLLEERDAFCIALDGWAERSKVKGKSIGLMVLPIESGFSGGNFTLLTEQDMFGERIIRQTRKKKNTAAFFDEAASLTEGELIVHDEHGIGRFDGLETVTAAGAPHDCLRLSYRDGDRLFVPVENAEVISRFGSDEDGVQLDKLGGVAWQARKAKLKERIKMAADALLQIAAERALAKGPDFTPPEGLYDEFCARFPFVETEDQLQAIHDVMVDLSSDKPMDRLICGDVGFGKTEVALRAAFIAAAPTATDYGKEAQSVALSQPHGMSKANTGGQEDNSCASPEQIDKGLEHSQQAVPALSSVLSVSNDKEAQSADCASPELRPMGEPEGETGGKRHQVALVCPTTLLARQHYQTLVERFAGLPYRIAQLSRLVSPTKAKKVKEAIAEGEVDIVVGTHALLAESIQFHRLGLLIVDEEQHFGVKQKERLKQLRANVHVLTLSATPIPRTLQLSLSGIKELSLITTPPVDRLAIRTFVMPYDPVVLREAILREHFRGGQIFYVCPRIKDLADVAAKMKELVPEITYQTAHGQMSATQLDDIMNAFYDGKFQMLIATNIIESGLDVPNANTMIVHKAHLFGLSQLYQIRGRVGRSKTRAYAYLTLPHGVNLTKNALKRLEVMQQLDALGAGFTIASHDMDIRGFGNVLGEEQSGHIKEVGVELYQQMLEEAVEAAKANQEGSTSNASDGDSWSPTINLGMPVLIPETYVDDLSLRLGLYRRAASLPTQDELDAFAAEMVDRFGPMPDEMQNLLDVVALKQTCRSLGIEKIDAGPKGAVISFRHNDVLKPELLIDYLRKHPDDVKLRPDQKLVLMREWKTAANRLKGIRKGLEQLQQLTKQ